MTAFKHIATARLLGALALLALSGCAGADGKFGPGPEPIVTDPPGALDDLGWIPYRVLLFNDRNKDGVLNAAEQRAVRDEIRMREMCEDRILCF